MELYQMGARWYDPYLNHFVSPDTIVPNPANPQSLNRYAYALNNPVRYRDPNGHIPIETIWDIANIGIGLGSLGYNLYNGNYGDAAWDAGGLVVDIAATAIPYVPGGAASALKASRAANLAIDASNAVDNTVDAINAAENTLDAAKQVDNVVGTFCSFSADTPVATKDGQEEISTLSEGDLVLAYNELLNTTGWYTVTAVLVHQDPFIVHLTIDGERIETTPEHPFYTETGEWVAAGDLQAGTGIRRVDGSYGTIQEVEIVWQPQWMYNLTVDQAHTFFVGNGQWLVHNKCKFGFQPMGGFVNDVTTKGFHMNFTDSAGKIFDGEIGLRAVERDGKILISAEALGKHRGYQFSNKDLKELQSFLTDNSGAVIDRANRVTELLEANHQWAREAELLRRAFGGDTPWELVK